MRRLSALLIAAGLAAAPAGAVAGTPSSAPASPPVAGAPDTTFEWTTEKPRLGVMIMTLTPELRTHFGAPDHSGVLVARVEPGSPAARAGLVVGDVVVDIRGHSIDDAGDVRAALATIGKGQGVAIKLIRDRKPVTVQATMASDVTSDAARAPWSFGWFRHLFPDPQGGPSHEIRT